MMVYDSISSPVSSFDNELFPKLISGVVEAAAGVPPVLGPVC